MLDHFKFLTTSVKETAKFTIPSAAQFRHREGVRLANTNAYTDLDEFWDDIGKSYNRAVLAFADLGCKYIQIDDVNSALLCDPKIRAGFEKYGGAPSQMLDVNIKLTMRLFKTGRMICERLFICVVVIFKAHMPAKAAMNQLLKSI